MLFAGGMIDNDHIAPPKKKKKKRRTWEACTSQTSLHARFQTISKMSKSCRTIDGMLVSLEVERDFIRCWCWSAAVKGCCRGCSIWRPRDFDWTPCAASPLFYTGLGLCMARYPRHAIFGTMPTFNWQRTRQPPVQIQDCSEPRSRPTS